MNGSLINRMLEEKFADGEVKVGMGATECCWTDRHAYEVIEVKDEKHITVRRLSWELEEGTDWTEQKYVFRRNPDNPPIRLYKTPKGWRERLGRNLLGNNIFIIGVAREYCDPSF